MSAIEERRRRSWPPSLQVDLGVACGGDAFVAVVVAFVAVMVDE